MNVQYKNVLARSNFVPSFPVCNRGFYLYTVNQLRLSNVYGIGIGVGILVLTNCVSSEMEKCLQHVIDNFPIP